jgi:hypothetical protein
MAVRGDAACAGKQDAMKAMALLIKLVPSFGFSCHVLQLIVPAENAHDTVAALGDIGLLQFKDMNAEKSAFQRTYANQARGKRSALSGFKPRKLSLRLRMLLT